MELDSIGSKRRDGERHDLAGARLGAYVRGRRQGVRSNDQRVVPTHVAGRTQVLKEMSSAVIDRRGEAVDRPFGGDHLGAENGGQTLMTETDPEDGDLPEEPLESREAVRRVAWVAGSRRNDERGGL